MKKHTNSELIQILKTAGYRLTRHRLTIVELLAGRSDHPSVKKIYNEVKRFSPEISLATVYNTLNSLVRLGVIREIVFEESDNRYDTNLSPHINLICTECGIIQDYALELPVQPQVLQKETGFTTSDYRLEYIGICNSCRIK